MNKVEEIFKAWNIAFNPDDEQAELASKRIDICNSCEHKVTNLGINRCSVCGCALKGKVFSPVKGACPKGKWDVVDGLKEPETPTTIEAPKENLDLKTTNSKIFVQIASYRDPELIPTLDDLFAKADHPDNLSVCIAWQHSPEDVWDNLDKYLNDPRVKILDIPHTKAKGACWARNYIQGQYIDEEYTLQLDSHHRFIQGWDTELINMYSLLQNKGVDKPLITGYLPSYNPEKNPEGRLDEVWKMDFNRFTPEGYIFVYPSVLQNWKNLTEPVPSRFFSAHFTFTTGKFCLEVPHDPNMYFHGEEPSLASRAYTYGYDLYHPHKVIAWHHYTREGQKKHWDDDKNWTSKNNISHRRFRVLHKMEEDPNGELQDLDIYGFGTTRTLEDYERYAGLRYRDRKVQQYTLDFKFPPNPLYEGDLQKYEESLLSKVKHCIDIHRSHFKHTDYDFWVVSFEMNDGTVVYRQDADEQEVSRFLQSSEWIQIWREYTGQLAQKWVIWPHSKTEGFVERYEQQLNG